jgi:hypothetical protein
LRGSCLSLSHRRGECLKRKLQLAALGLHPAARPLLIIRETIAAPHLRFVSVGTAAAKSSVPTGLRFVDLGT